MQSSPEIKISVLCDNQAKMSSMDRIFLAQHGLSIWIEAGIKILFDTGASDVFLHNAALLGIDVASADLIVLSHGHWDHANGLKYLPEMANKKKLLVHPGAFANRCKGSGGYNGMPFDVTTASSLFQLIPSQKPYQITDRITFLGEIPRTNDFEARQTAFFYRDGDERYPDFIQDDSALAITSTSGLIIITGCSHAGICNIVEHAKRVTAQDEVRMVMGGFHLRGDEAQLKGTMDYFKKNRVKNLYPMHCVDYPAQCILHASLDARRICAGDVLIID
jgi:7,8-dihydropterin-6-yl-methyl-4-(beta-D-ribofuranosyl)aminobenzene 5'-phosphate synthase